MQLVNAGKAQPIVLGKIYDLIHPASERKQYNPKQKEYNLTALNQAILSDLATNSKNTAFVYKEELPTHIANEIQSSGLYIFDPGDVLKKARRTGNKSLLLGKHEKIWPLES